MEEYLREISTGSREPSISYLIGSSGIGKKTFLSKCFKKLQFNPIHISPLFNKQSIVCAKKNMIQEIESLVLNQNITQFFSTSKDIIVLENLHVIPDKNFFDSLLDLKKKSLRSHIVCVLNTDFISERFLDYVIKSCDVFTFKSKSPRALRNIFRKMSVDLGKGNQDSPHPFQVLNHPQPYPQSDDS